MPIVFVHGVNNRDGKAYHESEHARDGFLREIVAPALGLKSNNLHIFSPYWGKYGAEFAWGMASLPNPDDKFESFGGNADSETRGRTAVLLAESQLNSDILVEAKRNFASAVDLLFAAAMAGTKTEEDARNLARSYVLAAEYADRNPQPEWVETATRGNFADQLIYQVENGEVEAFGSDGIVNSLKEGLSRLLNAAPDAGSAVAARLLRKKLNATVTRFAGDAFVYLNSRGTKDSPGAIPTEVLNSLREAHASAAAGDDKLVVIAHSFGGEIMYDILTHFEPSLEVDCLITVGSQVGLFEEMKLYIESRSKSPPNPPVDKIARPASLKRWLNVFDTNDVFSFRLEPVVSGVSDFHYDTGYSPLSAHGGYFMRPSFYRRMAARLADG